MNNTTGSCALRQNGRHRVCVALAFWWGLNLVTLAAGLLFAEPPGPAGKKDSGTPKPGPLERVVVVDAAKVQRTIAGEVLVEAEDGGLLVLEQDGRLWPVEKAELIERQPTGQVFQPLTNAALAKQLQAEFGAGVGVVNTKHYVICGTAGRAYAQWCGILFERLFGAFHNYWKQRGMKLREPEFPLVAIVFASEREFAAYAAADAGPAAAAARGYFKITANRMVLYDLTSAGRGPADSLDEINRRLSAAPLNIATVIHEATHQIAFNSGMHTRLADNPVWLTEGMAMFFETPDLSSSSGWKTVGAVNTPRLDQFAGYLTERPVDSLASLVRSDARFLDPDAMQNAYAEAWALTHFLIKTRKTAYVDYLRQISARRRLEFNTPEERLRDFRQAFGDDLATLDAEFIKYAQRLLRR